MQVESVEISGQHTYGGTPFPLVLQCRSEQVRAEDMLDWVRRQKSELERQASVHGAILFRGFPLQSVADFDAFVAATDFPNFTYAESLSNAVRINRTERVFTANEAPADVAIYFHHEMAQTPIYPSKLFFYCEQAAETGGATPLCRSDILLDRLKAECPRFVDDCRTKGLKYTNVMPGEADPASGMGRSWQSTLSCETQGEAEGRLQQLGYSWQWLDNGSLRVTSPTLPAIRQLSDGRESFFNQLIAASRGWKDSRNDPAKAITHGDGTPLDRDSVVLAAKLGEELAFDLAWQTTDVALVDNFVTMHARRPFTGTRKVLASLVAAGET